MKEIEKIAQLNKKFKDRFKQSRLSSYLAMLTSAIIIVIVLSPTIILLIVMLILVIMVNNYIKDLEAGRIEEANKSFGQAVKDGASKTWSGTKEVFGVKSALEKQKAKLAELQQMREDGIISAEEYEAKRKQILGL